MNVVIITYKKVLILIEGGGQGQVEVGRRLTFTSEREVNERHIFGWSVAGQNSFRR